MEVTADDTTVEYDPALERITVESGGLTLCSGQVGVRLADERPGASDDAGAIETHVDLSPADGVVDATLTVENCGDHPVRLAGLDPIDGWTPFGPTDRVFEHGYQSWSPTATLRLDERFPPESDRSRPQMVDLAAPDDARTSHGVTALAGDPGTLTLGFLDHEAALHRFDLRTDEPAGRTEVRATAPLDGIALDPGESREATLRIDATRDVSAALEAIADAVADRMDARVPDAAPTGWCSWYHYFTDVTADDVRANLDAVEEWGVDLDVIQIDDGYEVAFGDWRTLADGFDDMRSLREDVSAAGFVPGLWLAPFYVQADSRLAAEHPEWLVTRDGDPADAGARHGPMYALDATHPGVEDWLRETFATVVDDWGFEYCKLDFLYAAALPGDRHADVTRAEAYRHGLETIREAVGDAFVLGCGAPGFPSVGLVDAMRIGPDTAPYWREAGESASQPAHENAVRNVLNRQFCHRRLWLNDPDCQLVRTTTDLTDAERESFAALVAFSGGANVLSDRVAEIDDAGRRLFERTLPPVEGGEVLGVGSREFPDRIVCERSADGGVAVAAFNWADEPRTVRVDPRTAVGGRAAVAWIALASGDGDGRPAESASPRFDSGQVEPTIRLGPIERTIPPHGTLVVHCTPARDRPHLVGTRHLAGAATQVTDATWRAGRLAVTLDAAHSMDLVVATPWNWRLADEDADAATNLADGDADAATVVTVTADPGENVFEFTADDT